MTGQGLTVRNEEASILTTKAENLIAEGDLAPLTAEERIAYYRMRCDAAGLDWRTVPFLYVKLNGKLVLYPTKGATEQIGEKRNISIKILSKGWDEESYEVWCRASDATGRSVENGAMVTAGHLQGEALCNAKMKAITKATRRTILAFAGMGMIDESEIDDLSGVQKITLHEAHGADPYSKSRPESNGLRVVANETVDSDGVVHGNFAEEDNSTAREHTPPTVRLRNAVRKVWKKAEISLTVGAVCTALSLEQGDDAADECELGEMNDTQLCRLIQYGMTGIPSGGDVPPTDAILAEAKAFLS